MFQPPAAYSLAEERVRSNRRRDKGGQVPDHAKKPRVSEAFSQFEGKWIKGERA
ncbi:hypothetical protein [Fulvimarina manganoxydans]|uniref:hypothetical protein n=1 Tax=Fulvimarina manganoxydans TaxID=937218 RepID=UPI0014830573|nr:hypothetical protein [Fulvimarina manganoxydans]MEE2950804.1 hypothetical protein [Pseudomonadota bacterium]